MSQLEASTDSTRESMLSAAVRELVSEFREEQKNNKI